MAVEYVNRKGKRYYLHRRADKRGRIRYHFSQKAEGDLVEEIPEGYEIYEHPNAQVFLRKQREEVIRDEEVARVEQTVAEEAAVSHFLVDVRDKDIVVYTADQNADGLLDFLSSFGDRRDVTAAVESHLTYSAEMRFRLVDAEERTFTVDRYNYRGSVDDWMQIGGPAPLEKLAKQFLYHLGRDSYFELY